MVTNGIELGKPFQPLLQQQHNIKPPDNIEGVSFADTIKDVITDVNDLQLNAADMKDRFIKGEAVDLHDVMIASEEAKTSFQLLLELRNKFLDLYREVSRMQV